ncbi:hypothetical protein ACFQZ2_16105, partial [Streptomonospora algeriensis]
MPLSGGKADSGPGAAASGIWVFIRCFRRRGGGAGDVPKGRTGAAGVKGKFGGEGGPFAAEEARRPLPGLRVFPTRAAPSP